MPRRNDPIYIIHIAIFGLSKIHGASAFGSVRDDHHHSTKKWGFRHGSGEMMEPISPGTVGFLRRGEGIFTGQPSLSDRCWLHLHYLQFHCCRVNPPGYCHHSFHAPFLWFLGFNNRGLKFIESGLPIRYDSTTPDR